MSMFTTASGATYETMMSEAGRLMARKLGRDTKWTNVIAVFPSRLPAMEDTHRWKMVDGNLIGWNKYGTRTARLVPEQVRPGMLLWSPKGFKSTVIQRKVG
jgi:hypothetical protein